MSAKLHKTPGIVLRHVKFGETSLVVTMYTELFGIQSYIVNGVRLHTKKGVGKANLFQPSAMLDLVVYHHDSAHLNRIREFQWGHLYQHILTDVKRNAVAMFMMELLYKSLKQPEPNPDLFAFCRDSLLTLDDAGDATVANMPLYFSLHLAGFLGFRIDGNFSEGNKVLDLQEGSFHQSFPTHPHFLEGSAAASTAAILKLKSPAQAGEINLNRQQRRELLMAYETFYVLHQPDFGTMKTVAVLRALFE